VLGGGPGAPEGPLEGVIVGADECELDVGPARFSRSSAEGELAAELERIGAGSEPFAVELGGGDIAELGAGQGGKRSAELGASLGPVAIPFAPPVTYGGTSPMRSGYVLSRERKNYSVAEAWEAIGPLEQLLGGAGPISTAKAVAALARGRHTLRWVVAVYDPETCAYEVFTVEGDPPRDAFLGRLG